MSISPLQFLIFSLFPPHYPLIQTQEYNEQTQYSITIKPKINPKKQQIKKIGNASIYSPTIHIFFLHYSVTSKSPKLVPHIASYVQYTKIPFFPCLYHRLCNSINQLQVYSDIYENAQLLHLCVSLLLLIFLNHHRVCTLFFVDEYLSIVQKSS